MAGKRATKKQTKKAPVEEVVEEKVPVEETPLGVEVTVEETPGGTRKRKIITIEVLNEEFNDLIELIDTEIARRQEKKSSTDGIRFLRSVIRRTKEIQKHSKRIKKISARSGERNPNSGFEKKVKITPAFAKFMKVSKATLVSRTEGGKAIHAYIKAHNLQNPEDRRQIFPDATLTKLLGYDEAKHGKLMYFRIQQLMQIHFVKVAPTPSV